MGGDAVAVARIAQNMRQAAFTNEEIAQMLKALYISRTNQDARTAWAVLDRRRSHVVESVHQQMNRAGWPRQQRHGRSRLQ